MCIYIKICRLFVIEFAAIFLSYYFHKLTSTFCMHQIQLKRDLLNWFNGFCYFFIVVCLFVEQFSYNLFTIFSGLENWTYETPPAEASQP